MSLSRRTVAFGMAGVAGLLAWRYRVLQVGSFIAAAATSKFLHHDATPDFRVLASEWQTLRRPQESPPSQSRGVITYHPWYHQFKPSIANRCLAEAAELGAGYIRLDIRWKDLIPDGRIVDEAAWNWYQNYLTVACDWYGLRPIIVLSNPPEKVLHDSVESRLKDWGTYIDQVAGRLGQACSLYQILNEPNNPVFKIFPTSATPTAIASAARLIRQHNPDAKTAINILVDLPGWRSDLNKLFAQCGTAIDIVGLDYYPGTWAVSSDSVPSGWNRLADDIDAIRMMENSPLYHCPIAIIETGYSTNIQGWRGDAKQEGYFQDLERALRRWDERMGRKGLIFVGIHELTDSNTSAWLDPEAHFGLLTSETLDRKAGFSIVRNIFNEFR
jgi:hypothetical protein